MVQRGHNFPHCDFREDGDPDEGAVFDSDAVIPHQSYSLTFNDPGEFEYYCIYHPTMVGEVIVE